jgi:hypothetical protein
MSRLRASGIWVVESHWCDGFFLRTVVVKLEGVKVICKCLKR